jgi:preprotein translocase SecE subunit
VVNFLVQVWAELRRVQWPDRTAVTQATGVVIVFCILAGLYLALWDFLFSDLVKALL